MAEEVVDLFARHGFTIWGGYWDAPLDYQHFQVDRKLAQRLARLPEAEGRALFDRERMRMNANARNNGESNFDAGKTCIPGKLQ
jgi:hypothetical protein